MQGLEEAGGAAARTACPFPGQHPHRKLSQACSWPRLAWRSRSSFQASKCPKTLAPNAGNTLSRNQVPMSFPGGL